MPSNIAVNRVRVAKAENNWFIGTIIVLMPVSFGYTAPANLQIKNKWITDLKWFCQSDFAIFMFIPDQLLRSVDQVDLVCTFTCWVVNVVKWLIRAIILVVEHQSGIAWLEYEVHLSVSRKLSRAERKLCALQKLMLLCCGCSAVEHFWLVLLLHSPSAPHEPSGAEYCRSLSL